MIVKDFNSKKDLAKYLGVGYHALCKYLDGTHSSMRGIDMTKYEIRF